MATGRKPNDRLLQLARIPSTLFTALSVEIIRFIGLGISRSRASAWVATGLYCAAPSVLLNGRRAMQEGAPLVASTLLALLVLQTLSPVWWSWPLTLLLAGLTAGAFTFCVDGPKRRKWAMGSLAVVLSLAGIGAGRLVDGLNSLRIDHRPLRVRLPRAPHRE